MVYVQKGVDNCNKNVIMVGDIERKEKYQKAINFLNS